MTVRGVLIGESLLLGKALDGFALTAKKVWRSEAGDVAAGQPRIWTFIEFEAPSHEAEPLAAALSESLDPHTGWYCDFHSDAETWVVFAGRTFRYRRGDAAARAEATAYGRQLGTPEPQLDWPD